MDLPDLHALAPERSAKTKHWRGRALFTNNGLPLQCFVFVKRSGASASGSPIRTIKTELEPRFISVMKSGHIAVTQNKLGIEDAVHVIDRDGAVVGRIPGSDDHAPYSTCDQLDNIYVAMQHGGDGKINVKKYSAHGDYLETVIDELIVTTTPRDWIQIACISPTELVVVDVASVFIFRRRLSLKELMKIMI